MKQTMMKRYKINGNGNRYQKRLINSATGNGCTTGSGCRVCIIPENSIPGNREQNPAIPGKNNLGMIV